MLISPPFLPPRNADQTDEAWLQTAMTSVATGHIPGWGDETIAGSYPVSLELGWHGGCHLAAPPAANNTSLPVRAIADGRVIYVRQPKARTDDPADPLNYGATSGTSCWTSDGAVLVRHETDIGADAGGQAISVVFYSLYMHLASIAAGVRANRRIYRKDEIGAAGFIYGQPHRIHFEIFCDDANLPLLTGRTAGNLPTGQNGRSSVVFGEMYFHLPAGTRLYAQRPPANQPNPATAVAHTTTAELFIGVLYIEGDGPQRQRGDATVTTYRLDGSLEGQPLTEAAAEYQLYRSANTIAEAYPVNTRPAPSAVYELLRFGRIINTPNETLAPADVPHWREVRYPSGRGWVNLNAAGIHKFSDADFPHWKGWRFINDTADQDSRCDSPTIRAWFDRNRDGTIDAAEPRESLRDQTILHKLEHSICRFPTEWRSSTLDQRWGWLKSKTVECSEPLSEDDFAAFKAHAEALCFWERVSAPPLPDNPWRFHPRGFIQLFRKCGWLSLDEMGQLLPRSRAINSLANAKRRFEQQGHINLNRALRKYGFVNAPRQTSILAQIYIETGLLSTLVEGGQGAFNARAPMTQYYSAFYGRGMMQLTWPDNYAKYGSYRRFPNNAGTYTDPRITTASLHDWAAPTRDREGHLLHDRRRWSPNYDPAIIASNTYNAADSAGYYWIQKRYTGTSNMQRIADEGISTAHIGRMSVLVNGGGFGYNERQQYAAFIERYRGDSTASELQGTIQVIRQSISRGQWTTLGTQYDLRIDYTPQRD